LSKSGSHLQHASYILSTLSLGGCDVTAASQRSLSDAATLFGLNKDDLKQALTSRVMQATRSGV